MVAWKGFASARRRLSRLGERMTEDNLSAVYVDTGTTNSRVWLARGAEILVRADSQVGVRDTAKDGSAVRLRAAVHELIERVCAEAVDTKPVCVAAAGMITSS